MRLQEVPFQIDKITIQQCIKDGFYTFYSYVVIKCVDIALLLCPQRQELGSGADVLQKFGSTPPIPIQAQNNNATNNAGGADQGFKLWREMDLHRVRLQAQEEGLPAQPHRERTHDRRLSGLWMSSLPAGQPIGAFNPNTKYNLCLDHKVKGSKAAFETLHSPAQVTVARHAFHIHMSKCLRLSKLPSKLPFHLKHVENRVARFVFFHI